jgi:hydroxylysine kinase
MLPKNAFKKATEDESQRKIEKPPKLLENTVKQLVEEHFGIIVKENSVKEIESYDDRNYYIKGYKKGLSVTDGGSSHEEEAQKYLFKVHNGVESKREAQIDAQNSIMIYLRDQNIQCPVPQVNTGGTTIAYVDLNISSTPENNDGNKSRKITRKHAIRLLSWVEGETLNSSNVTLSKLISVGEYLGRLRELLANFDHDGAHRIHLWDTKLTNLIKPYIKTIDEENVKAAVSTVVLEFEKNILPNMDQFRKGVLQGDFNDANVIMLDKDSNIINGVIDFGDMVYSNIVNDLSICMAYMMLKPPANSTPLIAACAVLTGFSKIFKLNEIERSSLRLLVACRLATSVTLGAFSISQDPSNEYLKLHAKPGRTGLLAFWNMNADVVEAEFDKAIKLAEREYNNNKYLNNIFQR